MDAQRYRTSYLRSISHSTEWEFGPVIYGDGLVFMSNKIIPSTGGSVDENGNHLPNIYYVPFESGNELGKPELFSDLLYTKASDGPITFAQNDEMLCVCLQDGYVQGQYMPKNGNKALYFAYKSNDKWANLTLFEHTDQNVNYNTPFLTPDGRTLYFAAEGIDGGYGGSDIYVSRFEARGWTTPENLGPVINSPEGENSPFLHPEGKLYFSSNGHGARGGSFDLFSSNFFNGVWSAPVSVPSLNSYDDEFGMVISDDYSKGYFARKRGTDYDILRFEYPNYENFSNPRPIQKNRFCFRLRENSLDTINYDIFSYEWVINDTMKVPGHDIKFCFPGPGDYNLSFNVTNKVTDTVMYDVASLFLNLTLMEQPVITAPDTVFVGQVINFSSRETVWDDWAIDGYYWDFGNGVQEKGENVNYQYPLPGEYTVVLGLKEKVRRNPEKVAVYKDIVVLTAQ